MPWNFFPLIGEVVGGGGLYPSLGLFHVYSGSRACLLKVVTRTPTVLSLLPPKDIGGGRRANNEEKAEMEAKGARDSEL